ncbi:MAG: signal peptidase I [Halanaerobiales bacterium]
MEDLKELLQSLIIAGILAFFIITFVAQSFVVDGRSMEPTLENGDRLFVNKFIYRFEEPQRGDVIVFNPQGSSRGKYIKRVIGLPGEKISIRDGKTFIDGEPISEDYLDEEMYGNFGPEEIPEGHYFVMGDNRNHSADSRIPDRVGFVDKESIDGKAFWLYWPLSEMRLIKHYDYNL